MLDTNVFPIHIEFVRKNHGQMSFHALPNFGILGQDCDHAVRRNAEERHGRKGGSRSVRLSKGAGHGVNVTGDQNAATCYRGHSKEGTTVKKGGGSHGYLDGSLETLFYRRGRAF